MLNTVKSVLADVSSVSPSSEQKLIICYLGYKNVIRIIWTEVVSTFQQVRLQRFHLCMHVTSQGAKCYTPVPRVTTRAHHVYPAPFNWEIIVSTYVLSVRIVINEFRFLKLSPFRTNPKEFLFVYELEKKRESFFIVVLSSANRWVTFPRY